MTMQQEMGECLGKHENKHNSRKNLMICTNCENFVEVDLEQNCMCCGVHVKRPHSKNYDAEKFEKAVKELLPLIEFYSKHQPKKCKLSVNFVFGLTIRSIDLALFAEFLKTKPDDYQTFFNKVKNESPIVAINVF